MSGVNKVSWYEPCYLSWRTNLRALRYLGVFRLKWWLRVLTTSLVVFAIFVLVVGTTQGWHWASLIDLYSVASACIFGMIILPIMLVSSFVVIGAIPKKIDVQAKHVTWTVGDRTHRIRCGDLHWYRIDHLLLNAHRLTLSGKTTKNRTVTRRFWIRGSVNESELTTLLNALTKQETTLPEHLRA